MNNSETTSGLAPPWLLLSFAFALHILDEATTGFLNVYNPTVMILRQRWSWFPMPTFGFREWLISLIMAVLLCFAVTPFAAGNARWLRPLAWIVAVIQFSNAMGHTIGTILGHTVASVTFPRPAPGFYSSPLLFLGSIWLMVRLWNICETAPAGAGIYGGVVNAPPAHSHGANFLRAQACCSAGAG